MKIRKSSICFTLLLGVFLLAGSLFYHLEASAANQEDGTVFTVGFDASFPPYGYKDGEGEYAGFDLDLAQEVCNRRGWTLKKQPIDWDSKDMELNSDMIDCIWNGFTINGREDKYTWIGPYVDNSQVVLVSQNSGIEKLNDLEGKIVVVQADSSAQAALTGEDATQENQALAGSFGELQIVGDYNSAIMNLEAGAVDAICLDVGVAKYQQKNHDKLVILEETLSTEGYGIGFKKGNTKLRDQVQETLFEMLDDGTFQKIAEKYEDYNLPECICLSKDTPGVEETLAASDGEKKEAAQEKTSSGMVFLEKVKTGFANFGDIIKQLLFGFGATLSIFVLTLLFSLPLGLLITFGRMSKNIILRGITKFYISVMRGTPLMLQLLVVFFGPYYLFGVKLSSFGPYYRYIAVIIGFSLNYASYFAEIYRGGIESIPDGQREAAALLGYNRVQTFCKIIFPQMIKKVMPSVTNEIITLVKDTSLAFVLAYTEMFTLAKQIAASMTNIMPLFVAGIFYYIFNYLVAYIMEKIEQKLGYYK